MKKLRKLPSGVLIPGHNNFVSKCKVLSGVSVLIKRADWQLYNELSNKWQRRHRVIFWMNRPTKHNFMIGAIDRTLIEASDGFDPLANLICRVSSIHREAIPKIFALDLWKVLSSNVDRNVRASITSTIDKNSNVFYQENME